ncbi:hypothetical protein [Microcoleus anatoxicus]|uniref:hypothetical protein n=1 Tax=Microcoleus anatoxicus TaxID=2705319 RepID=UPI0030C8D6C2
MQLAPGEFDDVPSVRPGSNPQAPPFPQDPGPKQPLRPDFDNPTGQTTVNTQAPNLEGIWLYAGSYQPDFSGLVVGKFMRFSVVEGALRIDKCSSNCRSEIQYPVLNNSTVPFEQMLEVYFADDDMKIKLFPNKDFTLFLGSADKVEKQNSQVIYFFLSKLSQSKYPVRNNRQRKTSNKEEVFLLASNINKSKLEFGKKQEVFLLAEIKKTSNGTWSATANPHSAYNQPGGFSNANLTKDQALATRFTQSPTDTFTLGTPDTQRSGFGGKGPNNPNNNPSQNNNRGGNGSSGGNGNQRRNNNSNTGTSREEQAIQLGQDQAPQQIDLLQGGVNKIGNAMESIMNLGTQQPIRNTIAGVGVGIGAATILGSGNANASEMPNLPPQQTAQKPETQNSQQPQDDCNANSNQGDKPKSWSLDLPCFVMKNGHAQSNGYCRERTNVTEQGNSISGQIPLTVNGAKMQWSLSGSLSGMVASPTGNECAITFENISRVTNGNKLVAINGTAKTCGVSGSFHMRNLNPDDDRSKQSCTPEPPISQPSQEGGIPMIIGP